MSALQDRPNNIPRVPGLAIFFDSLPKIEKSKTYNYFVDKALVRKFPLAAPLLGRQVTFFKDEYDRLCVSLAYREIT